MAYSPKWVRGYLSSIGQSPDIGDALFARCVGLYGEEGWQVTPAGIFAGGKLVVPAASYAAFAYGVTPAVFAAPSPAPAPVEEEDKSIFWCDICGHHTATQAGMDTHMLMKHTGVSEETPTANMASSSKKRRK